MVESSTRKKVRQSQPLQSVAQQLRSYVIRRDMLNSTADKTKLHAACCLRILHDRRKI